MNLSTTSAATSVGTREWSEAELKRYFAKFPTGAIVIVVFGGIFLLSGLALQNNGAVCDGLGILLMLIGGLIIYFTAAGSKPSDREYDAWLERKALEKEQLAPRRLQLT